MDYVSIASVKCSCCGEMTDLYYSHSHWWKKYLKPAEEKVCLDCMEDREGFVEDFLKNVGVSVEYYISTYRKPFKPDRELPPLTPEDAVENRLYEQALARTSNDSEKEQWLTRSKK